MIGERPLYQPPTHARPRIAHDYRDGVADDITHYDAVEAYCGRLSYEPGESVTLHVSCSTDLYDVEIHRWGVEREPVWTSSGLPGAMCPTPIDADACGCGWPAAVTVTVPLDWRSGFYHIAHAARVPILPIAFDGEHRAIRLFAPFETSGDYEADLPRLMALYEGIRGVRV